MRIAMIGQKGIPAHTGGVEQHVDVLSKHLVARGHDVTVYCRRSYLGKDARSTHEGGLHRIFRPSIATKHLDAISHAVTSTVDVALRRADVVHYHAIGPAALAPLARLSGLPVVVTCHGLDWQRAKWGPLATCCLQFGERMAAWMARRLIVVSPVLKEHFQQKYGADAQFIPNGVMPMSYREPAAIHRWGLEPRKYLLTVARLVPEKGLHYLLEAFRNVKTDHKLLIAGGGGLDTSYEAKLRSLADDRVVFAGDVDRPTMAELYSHAELFVLPSDLEGMSIALLEAMNMGVPVLVSDIPENACVVEDDGFTFRAGNVVDLEAKLTDVLSDARRLSEYGLRAAEHVAPFQWPAVTDQLEAVYAACCGRQLPSADNEASDTTQPQQPVASE